MSRRTVCFALALLGLAACATVIGLDDFAITNAPADAAPVDAALADAASADAAPAEDGEDTSDACVVPAVPAITTAVHLAAPLTIDGQLDDWPCEAFTELDVHTAANVLGTPLDSAQIAVGWDATGIYFACRATDPKVEGTSDIPWQNDACELYLGVPPPTEGGLPDAADLHLIVDYANRAGNYDPGTLPMPPGLLTGATTTAIGFNVEIFVPASALGYAPSANLTRLFDVQLDDCQNGDAQVGATWPYFVANDAGCTAPTCNTQFWGQIMLAP